jgi:hypothetical protein
VLSDLLARLFIVGFFVAYLIVAILVAQWALRTWMGAGRRRPSRVKSKTPIAVPEAETAVAKPSREEPRPAHKPASYTSDRFPPRSTTA